MNMNRSPLSEKIMTYRSKCDLRASESEQIIGDLVDLFNTFLPDIRQLGFNYSV